MGRPWRRTTVGVDPFGTARTLLRCAPTAREPLPRRCGPRSAGSAASSQHGALGAHVSLSGARSEEARLRITSAMTPSETNPVPRQWQGP